MKDPEKMHNDINPYPGIHNKVFNKTRVIKKFVWWKRLNGKWKFFDTVYIQQKCLNDQYSIGLSPRPENLDWFDVRFTSRPTTFLRCDCGNELINSGSFVSDNDEGVRYKCTDCKKESLWDFDTTLVPIKIEIKPEIVKPESVYRLRKIQWR